MDGRWSPVRRSGSAGLRSFCNLATRDDFDLVLAWLLAGLRQGGPYPLLALSGEQGSARPDLADRAIFLSLPHNQEALPVELRGARASMACQHPTTPRGSAAVLHSGPPLANGHSVPLATSCMLTEQTAGPPSRRWSTQTR